MPVGRCPVLVERDDELNALSRLAGDGAAALVVVTGEAGRGKSRLAADFAASLPEPWTVARLRPGAALPPAPAVRLVILDDAHELEPAALAALPGWSSALVLLTFRLGAHPPGSAELRALARLAREPM